MVWLQRLSVSTSVISVSYCRPPWDWNSICVLTIWWSLMSKTFSWIIHACTADLHRKPGSYMYLITCGTSCVDIKWSPLIGLLFAVRLLIELLTWPITFVKLASFAACDWSITNPILCFWTTNLKFAVNSNWQKQHPCSIGWLMCHFCQNWNESQNCLLSQQGSSNMLWLVSFFVCVLIEAESQS